MRQEKKKKKEGAEPLQKRRGLRPAAAGGGACHRGDGIHRSGQAGRGAADGWEGRESGGAGENFLGRLVANQREDGGREGRTKRKDQVKKRRQERKGYGRRRKKSCFFFFKLIVGAEPQVARVREGWKEAGRGRGRSEDEERVKRSG